MKELLSLIKNVFPKLIFFHFQTPDLRKLLLKNQQELDISSLQDRLELGPGGTVSDKIKEEIIDSNPPSVATSISSDKTEEHHSDNMDGSRDNHNNMQRAFISGQEVMTSANIANTGTISINQLPSKFTLDILRGWWYTELSNSRHINFFELS